MNVRSAHLVVREWAGERELTGEHWFRAPAQVREERAGYVTVRDGDRWWIRDPDGAVEGNDGRPDLRTGNGTIVLSLLDPAAILAQLDLDERATAVRAGRPTVELAARAGPEADRFELSLLGSEADGWEITLDAEHGVLLAATALRDGSAVQGFESTHAEFDVPLDGALFAPPSASPGA